MSWSFLPELEAVFSEKTSSAFKRLAQSKLSRTAVKSCSSDSATNVCRSSRSGMTCDLSASTIRSAEPTSSGSAALPPTSLSAEAFLVRISRRAARVAESPGRGRDSGSRWRALSARYDRRSSSWKIAPCSPLAVSGTSSLRWPRWGMMQNGVCWALDTSDTPLNETGSGYWGNISRTMAGWMTPGTSKEVLKRATYGAQKQSLVSQMLRLLDLWPTVLLVELLMGWPPGWTALEPLAMAKYRRWRLSHGRC